MKAKTRISYTWRELLGEELLSYWNGTHMGAECVPPKRMFHAEIHNLIEMWVFEDQSGSFYCYPRIRLVEKDWWYARQLSRNERDCPPKSFEEAKNSCLRLLNEELNRVRRRFEVDSGFDHINQIFKEDLELTEEEK